MDQADRPPVSQIEAELKKVLGSSSFRAAPQMSAFLSFVVAAELAGRAALVKAYSIAVDALGRPESFDPIADAYVRVMAVKLRRALGRYYDGDGVCDPVVISLPRGSYVPRYRSRGDAQLDIAQNHEAAAPAGTWVTALGHVTKEAAIAQRDRRDLLDACHANIECIHEAIAGLRAEFAASAPLLMQSKFLIARSRSGVSWRADGAGSP